ncbi:hypothetical protein DUNSADRAFT_16420 [Dunaliella salina]|uniref:Encoded protein n=1 Tax=Dunaliella salina TaxID=3046 RepID=A0ABQ7G3K5_DUNSA|nr:hypothetical protein DUNSADRAFT_16420 [Dunaliella salina]|eukprot:KAF5829198.1 hypothetical protein DUNSADRAFT_16420 [Dunaliella salina]
MAEKPSTSTPGRRTYTPTRDTTTRLRRTASLPGSSDFKKLWKLKPSSSTVVNPFGFGLVSVLPSSSLVVARRERGERRQPLPCSMLLDNPPNLGLQVLPLQLRVCWPHPDVLGPECRAGVLKLLLGKELQDVESPLLQLCGVDMGACMGLLNKSCRLQNVNPKQSFIPPKNSKECYAKVQRRATQKNSF